MAPELAALIEAGRELAPEDRYELVHQMLVSVDEPDDDQQAADGAWNAELRKRIEEIESGAVELLDGEETMRLLRERIAERRAQSDR